MKDRFKKILLALVMSLAMLSLFGCAKQSDVEPMTPETEATIGYMAQSMFQQIISMPDEDVEELIDGYSEQQDTIMVNGLNAWLSSEEDLGEFVGVKSSEVTQDAEGDYTALIVAEFEQRDCEFTLGVNRRMTKYTNLGFSPVYTMNELIMEGLGNLVIGMGVVFAVLIFLAWVISLFKYIHVFTDKAEKKAAEMASEKKEEPVAAAAPAAVAAPAAPAPVSSAVPGFAPEEEMAVVLATAIAAYEADTGRHYDELTNGITVRKLRRGRR